MIVILFLLCTIITTFKASAADSGQAYIQGEIRDNETGNPIPNASIEIYDIDSGSILLNSTETNSDGTYQLEINQVNINIGILARADYYYINTTTDYIYNTQILDINLNLNPGAPERNSTLKGYITNSETNQPIDNAVILIMDNLGNYDITNSDETGYYSFNISSCSFNMQCNKEGFLDEYYSNETEDNSVLWANISMIPTPKFNLTVCGYVTDAVTKEPIEDTNVYLEWSDTNGNETYNNSYTDSQGFYSIKTAEGFIELEFYNYQYEHEYITLNLTNDQKINWVNISLEKSTTEYPPYADAGGPYNGFVNQSLQLNGSSSFDTDGNITEYLWNFGDGNTSSEKSPTHVYSSVGTYYAFLYVTDNNGNTDYDYTQVNIELDEEPPTKITGLTVTNAYDKKINLSWDEATDNDRIDHYSIYMDKEFLTNVSTNFYQALVPENYQTYTFKVEAVDPSGNIGSKSDMVSGMSEPSNLPPTAVIIAPDECFVGEEIVLDGTSSSDDHGIDEFIWDFGDGEQSNLANPNHSYSKRNNGEYTVTLTVVDTHGVNNTTTTIIKIPNRKPENPSIESNIVSVKLNEKHGFTFSSIDPDNDKLDINIDWGDEKDDVINNVTSGKEVLFAHKWSEPGKFIISAKSFDGVNYSNVSTFNFYVDSVPITKEISGYLVDNDNDGVYDLFHNDLSGKESNVNMIGDDCYLINNNDDDKWDYIYDVANDEIEEYVRESKKSIKQGLPFTFLILIVVIVVVSVIVFLWYFFKNRKDKNSDKKVEKKVESKPFSYSTKNIDHQNVGSNPLQKETPKQSVRYRVERIPNDNNSFDSFDGMIY